LIVRSHDPIAAARVEKAAFTEQTAAVIVAAYNQIPETAKIL
jgi:hypothetical protein